MSMISVTCRRCGNRLEVDDAFLGETLYCSSCNSAVKIEVEAPPAPAVPAPIPDAPPAAAAAAPPPKPEVSAAPAVPPPKPAAEGRKLRLAGDRIASGEARICPKCGLMMENEDRVCASCGFNPQTGVSMADVARRREALRQFLKLVTIVLVLIAGGWLLWRTGWLSFNLADLFRDESPAPAGTNDVSTESTLELPPPPPEVVAQVSNEVVVRMAGTFPVVADGEGVALELANGRVLRGTYHAGLAGDSFWLETGEGTTETHAMDELKPSSRLRCDPAYRLSEVEKQLRGRLGL